MTTFSWAGRLLPAVLSRATAVRVHPVAGKLAGAAHQVTAVLREVPAVLREIPPVVRQAPAVLREVPEALRPVRLKDVPAGWEHQAYDPAAVEDDDALTWLGFEAGEYPEPILAWPQPDRWPTREMLSRGRHRAPRRLQVA